MLQITCAPWDCVKLREMHVWKLMAMKSECGITSHDMLTWIRTELLICTSDVW